MVTIDLESYGSPHPSLTDTAPSSPSDSLRSESPIIKKKKKKNKSSKNNQHHRHRSIAVDNGSKRNQDNTDTTTKLDYNDSPSARDVESFGSDFTDTKPPRHAGRRPSVGLDYGKNNQSSLYHGSSMIEVPLGGNDELNQAARNRGTRNNRKKRVGKVYFIRHGESTGTLTAK